MRISVSSILLLSLGGFMIIIGCNKFFAFIEIPNPPGDGGALMQIYISSGFLKIVGLLEIFGGLGLVLNRFVPLSLIFITAIMFNATLFHLLHDPSGVGPAACCLSLSLVAVYQNRGRFTEILSA